MKKLTTGLFFLCIALSGCSIQNKTERSMSDTISETPKVNGNKTATEKTEKNIEIVVNFPFNSYDEDESGYILTLISPENASESHELKLCDKTGRILQQFSCGTLKEPLEFSYDSLTYGYGTGLQIFPADSQTGLLFTWSSENLFSEQPIEIPKYDEVRNLGFMGIVEKGSITEKTIYQINEFKERTERLREWSLDKSSKYLKISDYLENQVIFQGNVELDDDGSLKNNEYYDHLFWDDLNLIWDYSVDTTIPTWIMGRALKEDSPDESGFEMVQGQVFGNVGSTAEYASRQALLEDFGFADKEPAYEYFDQNGNLQLELYLDKETEKGCGIAYLYRFTSDLEKITSLKGFTIDGILEQERDDLNPWYLKSVYGTDGADSVTDYEEEFTYSEDGKLTHYSSKGYIDWLKDGADAGIKQNILNFHFIYRDDGSLFFRKYIHNGYIFGTTYASRYSYYDERERLVYEHAYITHGGLEFYYIYENNNILPTYTLCLDSNGGYVIPTLTWYQ